MPDVTVAVCTYNRAASLKDTLVSLSRQKLPVGFEMEVVVIDNNSKDNTSLMVAETSTLIAWPVRYVLETQQGIGYARNRGLKEALGEYVFFIDDDAVADEDWVSTLTRSFKETAADLIGGKIEPLWLMDRPHWVTDDLLGPVIRLDYGPVRKKCTRPSEGFLTANVGFRRSSLTRYGFFDETLGRRAERWIGGEDFELFERWLKKGAEIIYEPAAVVRHKVEPSRMTPEFYRRWFEDIGCTQAHQLNWKWHYRLSILPAWRWVLLLQAAVRYAGFKLLAKKEEAVLRAELWWRFQKSFFQERLDHWLAAWKGIAKPKCRFAKN